MSGKKRYIYYPNPSLRAIAKCLFERLPEALFVLVVQIEQTSHLNSH